MGCQILDYLTMPSVSLPTVSRRGASLQTAQPPVAHLPEGKAATRTRRGLVDITNAKTDGAMVMLEAGGLPKPPARKV